MLAKYSGNSIPVHQRIGAHILRQADSQQWSNKPSIVFLQYVIRFTNIIYYYYFAKSNLRKMLETLEIDEILQDMFEFSLNDG